MLCRKFFSIWSISVQPKIFKAKLTLETFQQPRTLLRRILVRSRIFRSSQLLQGVRVLNVTIKCVKKIKQRKCLFSCVCLLHFFNIWFHLQFCWEKTFTDSCFVRVLPNILLAQNFLVIFIAFFSRNTEKKNFICHFNSPWCIYSGTQVERSYLLCSVA